MTTLFDQPGLARTSDPVTSHQAAALYPIHRGSDRYRLLAAYAELGPSTDEQVGIHEGIRRVADTRRASELRRSGLIEPTGAKRPTATGAKAMVCRITPAGREALAAARKAALAGRGAK